MDSCTGFSQWICFCFKKHRLLEELSNDASVDRNWWWNYQVKCLIFNWKAFKKKYCLESILIQKYKWYNKIYFKNQAVIISKFCNLHEVCRRSWRYKRHYWRYVFYSNDLFYIINVFLKIYYLNNLDSALPVVAWK